MQTKAEPIPIIPILPTYAPPLWPIPPNETNIPYFPAASVVPPTRAWADDYARYLGSLAASQPSRQPGPVIAELERERHSSRAARKAYEKLTKAQQSMQAAIPLPHKHLRPRDADRKIREVEAAEEDFGRGQGLRDRIRLEDAYRQSYMPVGLRQYDGPTRGWDHSQRPRSVRWTERKIERGSTFPLAMPGAFPDPTSTSIGAARDTRSRGEELPVWANLPGWTFAQQRFFNGAANGGVEGATTAGQEEKERKKQYPPRYSMPTAAPVQQGDKFASSKDAVTPYGMPEHVSG